MATRTTAPTAGVTRDRLLDAATEVVLVDGAQRLTLDAVAKRAGVSKGGLLYHFPSKRDLTAAIVSRAVTQVDDQLALAASSNDPGAFARAYLEVTIPATTQASDNTDSANPLSSALLGAAVVDPALLQPLREAFGRWQARLENDGIDPARATAVRLAVDGWWIAQVLDLPQLSTQTSGETRRLLLGLTEP
ncbi:MAG: TetR/AcrR family transcriptional regulator [Actinomycetes bacterium]